MGKVINIELISNPANWAIAFLMVLLASLLARMLFPNLKVNPPSRVAPATASTPI